ncbi:hypothetical protein [Paracoccus cavernae]|uniref:hypothetical protein n=1 Tax=Paracoccus cavernae TaxID=1571207 RepID=UPI0036437F89
MRSLLLAAGLALFGFSASAQDAGSLADIRTELGQLTSDLQSLRAELVASGPAGFQAAGGDSAIDRMNAMEARLAQLTGQTEQLQNRIDRVVRDGTTRIGDIEFRLCEMEEGCDLGSLTTPTLGDQNGGAALPLQPVGHVDRRGGHPPRHPCGRGCNQSRASRFRPGPGGARSR